MPQAPKPYRAFRDKRDCAKLSLGFQAGSQAQLRQARFDEPISMGDDAMQHTKPSASRRTLLKSGAALGGIALAGGFLSRAAQAEPVRIRYATGGGIGPTEIETVIFLDWMKQNVLPNYGKAYTVDFTFTRSTPEAASLLAAGQIDIACQSWAIFAAAVLKDAVAGGMTIISDNFQEGRPDWASGGCYVLDSGPIKKVADLKGKTVAVNGFGSASDLGLRVTLKKYGLDAKKDIRMVEVPFPAMASAIFEKRVDAATMVLPFIAADRVQKELRPVFANDAPFGPYSVIFEVVRNEFLKAHPEAVKAFLADWVFGLKWLYDPKNRAKAIEITAGLLKSPPETLDGYFLTHKDYYRDPNGCVSAATLQRPIDAMVEEGFLAQRVDIAKYIDTQYLPAACPA
jgi:sulfonate transport system substrate-binding protein